MSPRTTALATIFLFLLFTPAESQATSQAGQREGSPPQEITKAHQQDPETRQGDAPSTIVIVNSGAAPEAQKEPPNNAAETQQKSAPDLTLIFTGVAALAALIQGVVLFATIVVMNRTARRQLRAYISVTAKDVLNWGHTSNFLGVMFHLVNCGQTPGFQMTFDFSMAISKLPPDDPRVTDRRYEAYTALFPGDAPLPTRLFFGRALTPSEMSDVEAGTRRFYTWGMMNYKDIFGRHRTTIFTFSCGGPDFATFIHKHKGAWSWENGKYHNEPMENVRGPSEPPYMFP